MKRYAAAAVALSAALIATPVFATQFLASVTGTLTTQKAESGFNNTGIDDHLSVGTDVTVTASFDSSLLLPWGDTGYSVVGLFGLGTTGNSFFRIDAAGLTWAASASDVDGAPFYRDDVNHFYISAPAIIIQGDKVIGLIGNMLPHSAAPFLFLGSSIIPGNTPDLFKPAFITSNFHIDGGNGVYGNTYNSPGFTGVWDFANSSVVDPPSPSEVVIASAVPEPAAWSMFLIGFGAIGFRMRQRAVLG